LPIEIFKTVSVYYKFWIPAFAGMTPVGEKLNSLIVIPAQAGKFRINFTRPKVESEALIQKNNFLSAILGLLPYFNFIFNF
jgi:hypothetical protein